MLTWILASAACFVQQSPDVKGDDATYTRTIEKRAADVLDELKLVDKAVESRVQLTIMDQYRGLRILHDARDAKIHEIQADGAIEKAEKASKIEAERASVEAASSALNDRFLAALAGDLSTSQEGSRSVLKSVGRPT